MTTADVAADGEGDGIRLCAWRGARRLLWRERCWKNVNRVGVYCFIAVGGLSGNKSEMTLAESSVQTQRHSAFMADACGNCTRLASLRFMNELTGWRRRGVPSPYQQASRMPLIMVGSDNGISRRFAVDIRH